MFICWSTLRAQCEALNLQVFAKWRASTDIKAELADLTDEADAILAVADKQEDGLTDDQQSRWDELMGDSGLVAQKQAELDGVEAVEAQKKELALARRRSSIDALNDDGDEGERPAQPAIVNRAGSLQAFRGDNAMQDAHDAGMWFRAYIARSAGRRDEKAEEVVNRRGWGFHATATEGTDTAGGHTVPDPVSAAFIEVRESVGVARRVADRRVMTSDTLKIPKLTAGPTVQYPGEASAITATDQTWGSTSLTAVKRAILSKVSSELQSDSLINFADNIVNRMGFEFAKREDVELINGDGTGSFGSVDGLINTLGAAGKNTLPSGDDTWGEIILRDITDTMGLLPSKYGDMTAFICSANFYYTVMLKLLTEAGGNTIAAIESGEANVARFLGRPVYLTDQMPTATAVSSTCLLYGNFREAVLLGDRESLSVMTSEHRYFEEDNLAIRGTTRYDMNVHEPGDGSNAGAFVGLVTAAS